MCSGRKAEITSEEVDFLTSEEVAGTTKSAKERTNH